MKLPLKAVTHRLTSIVAVGLILAMTTGCTITAQHEDPQMTPHHGRDAVVQLVVDTTEQLEPGNWSASTGTATAQSCTMSNGDEGAAYQFVLWSTEHSDDVKADAELVADYWASLGMTTRIAAHGEYPVVYGNEGLGQNTSFDTDAAGQTFSITAVAHCAPGDASELKREAIQQRENGTTLPGDEYVPAEG